MRVARHPRLPTQGFEHRPADHRLGDHLIEAGRARALLEILVVEAGDQDGAAAPALAPVKPSLPSSSAMAAPPALVATVTSKDLAARKGFARAGDHLLKEATLGLAGFEGRQWKTFEVGVDRVARL